ncbi:MAG: hypothetical protein OXN17_19440, partial [Candidatus Poribacteria bacterium]|nr:hypothetical protein [Candidatus Poribacteria bacterium]
GESRPGGRSYQMLSYRLAVDRVEANGWIAPGFLLEFYRARYPLACWISTALAIHSLAGFLSLSIFSRLILRYSLS